MDEMLKRFATLVSPEQKEVEARVAQEGGVDECLKNDRKLSALIEDDSKSGTFLEDDNKLGVLLENDSKLGTLPEGGSGGVRPYAGVSDATRSQVPDGSRLEDFRRELRETAETAMDKNWAKFTGKLRIMEANILRETEKIVERSSDRAIAELTKEINKGPQNNILDRVSRLRLRLRQRLA
jgi:hypothetical protein